jgi:hypothetical protein
MAGSASGGRERARLVELPNWAVTSTKEKSVLYWIVIVILILFAAGMVMRSRTRRR